MDYGAFLGIQQKPPSSRKDNLPDYIRYHKTNKLDHSYFAEPPEDDGFQFRKKDSLALKNRATKFSKDFEREVSPSSSDSDDNKQTNQISDKTQK